MGLSSSLPDELNAHYARFEANNTSSATKLPVDQESCAPSISVSEVFRSFKAVNPRKAPGPDGIHSRWLRACANQLAEVFTDIFNLSLRLSAIPTCFKRTKIVPVPKKPAITCLNDYRSVALTSTAMKCFERLVKTHISSSLPATMDPHQFAYRSNRSTDDAVALTVHSALTHLDRKNTYVRTLFIDYSSAFNTIIPAKLIPKLTDLGLNSQLCNWVLNFQTESILTACITVWYASCTGYDRKALRRVDIFIVNMRDSAEYRINSRKQLLALRPMGRGGIVQTIPAELRRKYRGCRAGAKLKAKKMEKRRRYKPSVPSVVMGNVNSLTNKTDELACLVKNQRLYRECSLFCFTETWLTPDTPDANVELPGFSTFVDCPTRKHRTIDLLYANVRDAYRATPLPPLGKSDHNLVFLQPQYKPLVLRQPTTTRSFRVWSPEAEEALKDCYDTTDWSVLLHPHGEDIEGVTHCVTDYLNFCMDVAVPTKTVRCFPNNKPWITSDIKDILNQKKRAFKDGNWTELKRVQGELKIRLKEAKESYRKKVERKLQDNNMKEVWGAMKTITGCKNNSGSSVDGGVDGANQFNNFYNRFDCPAPAPAPAAPSSDPPAAFTTLSSPPSLSPPPSPSPSPPSPSPPPSQSSSPLSYFIVYLCLYLSGVSELRMVLLGKNSSEISRVGNFILSREAFDTEAPPPLAEWHNERARGMVEGRYITLINTPHLFDPGLSLDQLRVQVTESMSLCAPGPHVIVLVLQPNDFNEVDRHRLNSIFSSRSEKPHKHTLILTTHTPHSSSRVDPVQENIIKQIITECRNRHFEFSTERSRSALIEVMENMVKENGGHHEWKGFLSAPFTVKEKKNALQKIKER
ncbi:hypothetical protein NFI96_001584, partial [Prochilodus magdalenae]